MDNTTNNYLKKSKNKNKNVINISPISVLYTSGNEKKEPITPPLITPKIIFLKNEKSNEQIQVNENIYNEDKKDGINCVLRNTFTNVKIYPTTYLNNKIIYQKVEKNSDENNNENIERNQGDNNKNENNSNDLRRSNSKIKREKIVIDISDKNINKINNEYNFQSIEEIHYFFVDTLQKGKKFAIKLDKYNN